MRELVRDEYAPTLAFTAAVLMFGLLMFAYAIPSTAGTAVLLILLGPVALLVVHHVHAEPWARLAGYLWGAAEFLAGLTALMTIVMGGDMTPVLTLTGVALLAAAIWIVGAALADEGAARALGGAAAVAVTFAGILDLAAGNLQRAPWPLARYVQVLSVGVFIAWLVVLGRDLGAGKRKWRATGSAP